MYLEKLEKHGVALLQHNLGNRENKEKFFAFRILLIQI